jgi:asparagine synthase (glutamine-hydrolysing)
MCGITGIYNFRSRRPVEGDALERMTRSLAHRGPDDEGFFFDGALGLGHRRLSILDLSERGHQPMTTADGRYTISYNGEIYNYLEVRNELESLGQGFHTGTDTEVVLTLYSSQGANCLKRLNGMFAIAIWDSVKRTLFLARDRVGIKPLYYAETAEGIVFGSEVKALLASTSVGARVCLSLIDTYFNFGYVPGERTLFEGIKKLLPGHWLMVGPEGIKCERYWDLEYSPDFQRSPEDAAEGLRELLLDAVRIHMRSDVPVGVFLSGGLDSSTTVALLAEAGVENVKTFSVAYREGAAYDETAYASLVADRFKTDHHVLYIDPAQFQDFVPNYVWFMDEPVSEAAAIALYFIAKHLRDHVTVALSGEGADELYAGYDIYKYMGWIEHYRKLPQAMRSLFLEPLLSTVGGEKLRKYLRLAQKPLEERYLGVSLNGSEYHSLYTREFSEMLREKVQYAPLRCYYAKTARCDPLTRMLYSDLNTWLVDDLLIKADKMTMANSVELRVPFLDYRVVEQAATIPSSMKIRSGEAKWILKQAMRNRLPDSILTRKKTGFPTPLAAMFRQDLSGYLRDLLLSSRCTNRGYFKHEAVERLIEEHFETRKDHHKLLWQLIVIEEWHRQFIDRSQVDRLL